MSQPLEILNKYWGFQTFRPMQDEIVDSVLAGHDTLALLPTGGGKSVCFQVPALCKEGLCLVVSPLIALMRDQVEQLRAKGIRAEALYSGMSRRQIDTILDNCRFGDVKFLYVSPERLKTELFLARSEDMNISLLAIDEAHCISQWGYDFRPPYLEIAEFRQRLPEGVPVIALTATATEEVQSDIMERLEFRGKNAFRKSFARDNLSYSVRVTDDKEGKLVEILKKVPGTAVVYARTRKRCQDIAQWLRRQGIQADYYHAGLHPDSRATKQEDWIKNRCRVIVATNAFGMGIDKPDVRVVAHLDIPDTPEAYYQEAGRAGRDGKKAFAVIIIDENDPKKAIERIEKNFPTLNEMRHVYQCLANHYKLAIGSGEFNSFDFDLPNFSKKYGLNPLLAYNSVKKLAEEGYFELSESFHEPSKVNIKVDNRRLYEFRLFSSDYDAIIQALLRFYGGELFGNYKRISESNLATALETSPDTVAKILRTLQQMEILDYDERKDMPQLTYLESRHNASNLPIDVKRYEERKELIIGKAQAMADYTTNDKECRTRQLLAYFGEEYERCGVCDVCVSEKKISTEKLKQIRHDILLLLRSGQREAKNLHDALPTSVDIATFAEIVREMAEDGQVRLEDGMVTAMGK
ncbi:ATP-dependent DNA helicase RecQ [Fulvitalea axinellae]|uniref:ATP-dependent DNA helicase RecQ n=1 Tax=Fulvitalea axinellae TaxID=1182444 RepID=A0AAU9CJM1_9BACT|nr:ATP-dependent DNA helicase RecQ [Fulvitalea axinellae]